MSPDARSELEKRLDKYRNAVAAGWKGAGPLPDPDAATHEQVIGGRP